MNFVQKKIQRVTDLSWFFWLCLTALIFGYAWFYVEETFALINLSTLLPEGILKTSWLIWLAIISVILVLTALLNRFISPWQNMRIQKLRRQPSWIFYAYFSLLFAPLVALILKQASVSDPFLTWELIWWYPLSFLIGGLILYVLPLKDQDKLLTQTWLFPAGSVSTKNDGLEFAKPAREVGKAIMALDREVEVVAIYGDLGQGKSSFTRMIVESLNSEEVLYSYISLTETNEARGFSTLFNERWSETLSSRYPRIDHVGSLALMRLILRESGKSFLAEALEWAAKILNRGLTQTLLRRNQSAEQPSPQYAKPEIASLFGNIPNFKEKAWVIVVDEIERAQSDEVYRVIEIIERFKMAGEKGLPIQLIFVLCVSRSELRNTIRDYRLSDQKLNLINQFFFHGGKSITHSLFLPPISESRKQQFVINNLRKLQRDFKIPGEKADFSTELPIKYISPENEFLDTRKAMNLAIDLLCLESPRVIERVINEVGIYYAWLKAATGEARAYPIRFSDIIMLYYALVRYPEVIDFLRITVEKIFRPDLWIYRHEFIDGFKENKKALLDWIEETAQEKVTDPEIVTKIVTALSRGHLLISQGRELEADDYLAYEGSSSDPNRLLDFLRFESESSPSIYGNYVRLFQGFSNKKSPRLKHLSTKDLAGFSRFLVDSRKATPRMHLQVAEEILDRFREHKIPIELRNVRERTDQDELVYRFIFALRNAVNKEGESRRMVELLDKPIPPSTIVKKATQLLVEFLLTQEITTQAKFYLISAFLNTDRNDQTVLELQHAFTTMRGSDQKAVDRAITYAVQEADDRYFSGKHVIYEHEENYLYVLFQRWDGNPNNKNLIKQIRATALNGLEKFPDAVSYFWEILPDPEDLSHEDKGSLDERMKLNRNENMAVYITLPALLNTSRKTVITDAELRRKVRFYQDRYAKNGLKELQAVLDVKQPTRPLPLFAFIKKLIKTTSEKK